MSNNFWGKTAALAAIVSACLYAIDFFNLNPFKSNNNQSEHPVTVIEATGTNPENNIVENNEITKENKSNLEIINLSKAKEMSLGEVLSIPFKKHEKANYLDIIERKFTVTWWILWVMTYLFMAGTGGLLFVLLEVFFEGTNKDKLIWISLFFICICYWYYALSLRGLF